MTYQEQLRDHRWLSKRAEVINRANGRCEQCDNELGERLEVHHGYYVKGKLAWQYDIDTLYCLCSTCHWNIQGDMDELYEMIAHRGLELPQIKAMINKNFETREQKFYPEEYKAAMQRLWEEKEGIAP